MSALASPAEPAPAARSPLVFVVAGEPSGDALGARLMAALARATGARVRFAGVGGRAMTACGLDSLFPMSELSLMGLAEIIPHIPRVLRRLRETAAAVARLRPDVVVTIDSPGFSFRLARRIRALGVPMVHYVAPQVWAWRPKRAQTLAGLYDHLIAVLPFEPAFFAEFGVRCSYVGHPVVEGGFDAGDGARFRARHGLAPETPVVAVLPGSRRGEVDRLLPVYGRALTLLAPRHAGLRAVVPTTDTVAARLGAAVARWPVPAIVVGDPAEHADAFAASRAAITKSGTSTLQLALAGVPMVVCYRVNPLTAFLARRLITVANVALVNLLADEPVVPELLQERCTPQNIADALDALIADEAARSAQRAALAKVAAGLGTAAGAPSELAARIVLDAIEAGAGAARRKAGA